MAKTENSDAKFSVTLDILTTVPAI